MKLILIALLFWQLAMSAALAQSFGLSKDMEKTTQKKQEVQNLIRPPKMNYATICNRDNRLNHDGINYYLQEESEGRFNSEKYLALAKIYYYGMGKAQKNQQKAFSYSDYATQIQAISSREARAFLARITLKALKNGDEMQLRNLQNLIDEMKRDNFYQAQYFAGELAELQGNLEGAYSNYSNASSHNYLASLAIARLSFAKKIANHSPKKTIKMVALAQKQLLGELNSGNCAVLMPLADMFLQGKVMKPQPLIGIEWLQIALQSGYSSAGVRLGNYYANGDMVEQSLEMAQNFWLKAANIGSKRAMFLLAKSYSNQPEKRQEVIALLEQAAKLNYVPAQKLLKKLRQNNNDDIN